MCSRMRMTATNFPSSTPKAEQDMHRAFLRRRMASHSFWRPYISLPRLYSTLLPHRTVSAYLLSLPISIRSQSLSQPTLLFFLKQVDHSPSTPSFLRTATPPKPWRQQMSFRSRQPLHDPWIHLQAALCYPRISRCLHWSTSNNFWNC